MTKLASIRVKANACYTCRECGSTELIQGHHEIPDDDDSLVALCAGCHSEKHPDVPRALFFSKSNQPYWNNKSAASLAKELGVHSRTIIRAARKLGILSGGLSPWDEELIKSNIPKLNRKVKPERILFSVTCKKCGYRWLAKSPSPKRCPKQALHRSPKREKSEMKAYHYFCAHCVLGWISLEKDTQCPCGHEIKNRAIA